MLKKQVYEYSGPVIVDGRHATWKWTARTWAVSPQKARSNLVYRFKEQNNLCYRNNVVLDGDVVSFNETQKEILKDFEDFKQPQLQLVLDI